MDCNWVRPRIPAWVDKELGQEDAAAVGQHLDSCTACAAAANREQALVKRLRSTAAAERAPQELAARILGALDREPMPAASPSAVPVRPRRAFWVLASAAAAALLLAVLLPWSATPSGLVTAMAQEHHRRVKGSDYRDMALVSADTRQLEKYLSEKLGIKVDLPIRNVPEKKGACCGKANGHDVGIVGCFCKRRNRAVTIFVVRSEGLDLTGLKRVVQNGREFLCGSSGGCRAVMWMRGELCYALVGELDPYDLRDMARRAAGTLDDKAAPIPSAGKTEK
jgi:anti-sigma factor (TIGR02949 family)